VSGRPLDALRSLIMQLELRHLRWVVTLADELHFARAAERLGMSRQSLSNRIRAIEGELGHPLFVRTTRKVGLTPAGEAFVAPARRALSFADEARRAAARVADGSAEAGADARLPASTRSRG
jgi:DNA-binding transcriptional LysR family regulator